MLSLCLALLDETQERDKFEQLYYQYKNLMFYVANAILQDTFLAEDAVQTALFKIARCFYKIDEVDCHKTKSFVVIVTENVAKTMYAKEHRLSVDPLEVAEELPESDAALENVLAAQSADSVLCQLRKLPREDQQLLILYHVHGYKSREIAAMLDMQDSTVRKRLERARKRLAALLREEG